MNTHESCRNCGAEPGQYHQRDCDVERCPFCGHQLITCDCEEKPTLDDRMPWSGEFPGIAECREFGLWAKLNPNGPGWIPCDFSDPDAHEDLNTLMGTFHWDRLEKRWRPKLE